MSMDEAIKRYPDLVKQYFARVFPPEYKFASLNIALWVVACLYTYHLVFMLRCPLS